MGCEMCAICDHQRDKEKDTDYTKLPITQFDFIPLETEKVEYTINPRALRYWSGASLIKPKKQASPLEVVLTQQIAELTKGFKGQTKTELPDKRDLHTYRDALNSAIKNCTHSND